MLKNIYNFILTVLKYLSFLKIKRKHLHFITEASFFILLIVLFCSWQVNYSTRKLIFSEIQNLPTNHAGLVLGTSKYGYNGNMNLYFKYRMEAAVKLFFAKKIKYLIVSGDNRKTNYNEPEQMRKELIKRGVPDENIILDFAGFRTLDSVIRSKKVFKQDSITIISQAFHNKRALYIAKHHNIKAIAFNARSVNTNYGLKTNLRELMARVKMFIDLYISDKKPYFLGNPINIPE